MDRLQLERMMVEALFNARHNGVDVYHRFLWVAYNPSSKCMEVVVNGRKVGTYRKRGWRVVHIPNDMIATIMPPDNGASYASH